MTIEQLLECSADQLEQMTREELDKHFAWCYHITRPLTKEQKKMGLLPGLSTDEDEEVQTKRHNKFSAEKSARQRKLQETIEMAKKMGIDLKL